MLVKLSWGKGASVIVYDGMSESEVEFVTFECIPVELVYGIGSFLGGVFKSLINATFQPSFV